jgi:NADH-quinone oxidoreductase subunit J
MQYVAFFLIALLAIASALGLVLRRNPIHGALFLVMNLGCVAVLYLMLGAEFLAAA